MVTATNISSHSKTVQIYRFSNSITTLSPKSKLTIKVTLNNDVFSLVPKLNHMISCFNALNSL